MTTFHIGCSGYHYRHWRGAFYPEKMPMRLWFEYYSQHFRTLELNVTFYRFPKLSFLENWYAQSPADFRFAVKVPQLITHYKQFNNVKQQLGDFYDTTGRGLLEKLGPILFQLPPRLAYDPDRLARILDCLDPSFLNVLEFRHPSWWRPEVHEELVRRKVIFCGQSHPQLPDAVVATAPVLYYRFHGVPDLYRSPYDEGFLRRITSAIQDQAGVQEAYVYFNNDIDASAIGNARQMLALV
ncbi:DUF72 domain-containing protein [Hymenobacter sp. BT770]|uniref:DUF72 domain-containing protein n=1 Tax=Hymenobacter sp. BT770 TaxID=2886942 RepID=UPI001D11C78A|nr:DUF72 domain-containing protein [Hymenobacter sp. BT770]MCC3151552.1 DUF72 domain-containing protein [Hymenobacter sp. BT770]MDO3413872.1 DUF72 domain-containing protein [Hymenobacter sp. BT770]